MFLRMRPHKSSSQLRLKPYNQFENASGVEPGGSDLTS